MSSIATFHLLETANLSALQSNAEIKIEKTWLSKKTVDTYYSWLAANSREVIDFQASGHVFATLLSFLEEKGIDLMSEHREIAYDISQKRGDTNFILTHKHRQQYLDKLTPEQFTTEELLAFNIDFVEDDDPALVEGEILGIKAIRDSLTMLVDDSHVILLSIG